MRFSTDAGYILVRVAGALLIVGAVVLSDSAFFPLVVPLLMLVFVLAIVFDAISGSRNSDA